MTPNFATRRPWLFTVLLVLSVLIANLVAGAAASIFSLETSNTSAVFLFANMALAILVAALLSEFRWWRHVGFRALGSAGDLKFYWLPFTLVLVNASFGSTGMSLGRVVYFIVLAGLIGFVEEGIFRGLILRALAPRGSWIAALTSSLVFGVVHALNALTGADVLTTLLQIGYALAIGFGFAAIALRTQVIWPLVVIHALIDFTSSLATDGKGSGDVTTIDALVTALYIVGFTVFGIYVMRSVRPSICMSQCPVP